MKVRTKIVLKKAFYPLYSWIAHRRIRKFSNIKAKAGGMLPPATYKLFYEAAQLGPDLDIVEIGGASGASSISLALGMQDSGKQSNLIVVEKCEGGSRLPHGGYEDNFAIIVQNLKKFGVWDRVRLYPHYLTFENGAEVQAMIETNNIGALVHDADGRVDRDFSLFWERLITDGLILIDDCEDKAEFREISERYPDGGTKKLTTYRLVQKFLEWGLLEIDYVERGTIFAHKPGGANFANFDLNECRKIVDQIMRERVDFFSKADA